MKQEYQAPTAAGHPITPPPELVQQWYDNMGPDPGPFESFAIQAARWGADQELEACVEWTEANNPGYWEAHKALRAARRPKLPSLKEQALDELHISFDRGYLKEGAADIIRRALEALPDD